MNSNLIKMYYAAKELHNNKFLRYRDIPEALVNGLRNNYTKLNDAEFRKKKTSDTIFLLGSGPSLNWVSDQQWKHISERNSFGLNFSFLKPHIPTFYQPSYHRAALGRRLFREEFGKCRDLYSSTVWMLSTKAKNRLAVPWLLPDLFPSDACIYEYVLPEPLVLDAPQPFCDADFDKSAYYRGTMSLVLYFSILLKYKKIVLLGVDPETWEEFFCNYSEMREYVDQHRTMAKRYGMKFESMTPKPGKYNPIDEYYFALAHYLKRKKGIDLCIGFSSCLLAKKLPVYFK